jgi:hypothetical protein
MLATKPWSILTFCVHQTVHDGQRIFLRVAAEGRRGRRGMECWTCCSSSSIILKLLQQGMGRNSSSSKAFLHVIYWLTGGLTNRPLCCTSLSSNQSSYIKLLCINLCLINRVKCWVGGKIAWWCIPVYTTDLCRGGDRIDDHTSSICNVPTSRTHWINFKWTNLRAYFFKNLIC